MTCKFSVRVLRWQQQARAANAGSVRLMSARIESSRTIDRRHADKLDRAAGDIFETVI